MTFDKKRRQPEKQYNDLDEIDIFIESSVNAKKKKSNYDCVTCDIPFDTANSLCQHKRSQKHEKNR